jgi:hypothetical protein
MYFGRVGEMEKTQVVYCTITPTAERNGRREVGERELEGRDQNLARKRAKPRG